MENENGENNADLVIKKLRILQEMFYRHDLSDNDLFKHVTSIINVAEDASKEIRVNYEEVSQHLTNLMNGKPSKNVGDNK